MVLLVSFRGNLKANEGGRIQLVKVVILDSRVKIVDGFGIAEILMIQEEGKNGLANRIGMSGLMCLYDAPFNNLLSTILVHFYHPPNLASAKNCVSLLDEDLS